MSSLQQAFKSVDEVSKRFVEVAIHSNIKWRLYTCIGEVTSMAGHKDVVMLPRAYSDAQTDIRNVASFILDPIIAAVFVSVAERFGNFEKAHD